MPLEKIADGIVVTEEMEKEPTWRLREDDPLFQVHSALVKAMPQGANAQTAVRVWLAE